MTSSAASKLAWPDFATVIADATRVPVERVSPQVRLIEDLGADSLALTEVIVVLLIELDMTTLDDGLTGRRWDAVTVGELYDEYLTGRVAPRKEATFRLPPRQA